MVDLSIIIVSYNTAQLTKQCLDALYKSLLKTPNLKSEIIVVDNASTDETLKMLKKYDSNSKFKTIINKTNLGYGQANNIGLKAAIGKYILFLNSDVIVQDIQFDILLGYMDEFSDIGVLTVKVILPNGKIDMASHRGFPTIWNSLTYYLKLENIFGSIPIVNKLFGGYHLTFLNLNTIHEIDSPCGAFYLTRKKILDQIGGFDTSFFMYGEDLDLSYRIKKADKKIVYYPKQTVLHMKYQSGLNRGDKKTESNTKKHFYEAMEIFYNKHNAKSYPTLINKFVHFGIKILSKIK